MLASSYASVIFDGIVRWLWIFEELSYVLAKSHAQTVCNDRMDCIELNGIVYVSLKWGWKSKNAVATCSSFSEAWTIMSQGYTLLEFRCWPVAGVNSTAMFGPLWRRVSRAIRVKTLSSRARAGRPWRLLELAYIKTALVDIVVTLMQLSADNMRGWMLG